MSSPAPSMYDAVPATTANRIGGAPGQTAVAGFVYNIQRCSLQDGPGIRTTVFLKGCPLSCPWCHNPESRSALPESLRLPSGDVEQVGRAWTVDEVLQVVERDMCYYQASQGGLTISGGEPLAQPHFTRELLRAARRRGLHTALDTSGAATAAVFAELLAGTDLVLFDLKETDPDRHRRWTGVSLTPILENLRLAAESSVEVWLRLPVVPPLNDRDDHWSAAAAIVGGLSRRLPVYLLPYHPLGESKLHSLGRHEPLLANVYEPARDRLREIARYFAAAGLTVHLPDDEIVPPLHL